MKRGFRAIAILTAAMQICFSAVPAVALAEEAVSQNDCAAVQENKDVEGEQSAEDGKTGEREQPAKDEGAGNGGLPEGNEAAKDGEEKNAAASAAVASSSVLRESMDAAGRMPEEEAVQEPMDISATIPTGNEADFTVIIPSEIVAGTLRTDLDTELRYSISAEMTDGEEGYLRISSAREGVLYHEEDSACGIPFENRFGTKKLRSTELDSRVVIDSSLLIRREDVRKAKAGEYMGTILFEIEYVPKEGGKTGEDPGTGKPDKKDPQKPEKKPGQKEEKLEETGKYYARMSLRRNDDFEEKSMCEPLFFEKADLDVGEENTKLTMYIIDPVPSYPEYGTPLKNVRFLYNGKSYKAKVGGGRKLIKHFSQADGFIDAEGDYETSVVTVTLPNAAIRDSVNGDLQCEAYVNAVMKSTQKFRVVLDDIEKGKSETKKTSSIVLEDKAYISDLTLAEGKNKKKKSALHALFSHKADILPDGDSVSLTLYFIDPVPAFSEEGTAFSEAYFLYEGQEYEASIDTSDSSLIRKYQKTEGNIPETGDYKSGKMQAELPGEAVNASRSGKLRLRMQVKAGQDREMTVSVFLENLKGGSTKNSARVAGIDRANASEGGGSAIPAAASAGAVRPEVRRFSAGKPVMKQAAQALSAANASESGATAGPEKLRAYRSPAEERKEAGNASGREGLHLPELQRERALLKRLISISLLFISSGVGYGLKRKFL